MAVFNGKKFLDEQVRSVLSQEGVNIHLLISVDLSSDLSYELCERFSLLENRISIMSYGRVFGGPAMNFYRLITECDTSGFDYIALADQDDIWDSQKLIKAIDLMHRDNSHCYSSNLVAFWPNGVTKVINKSRKPTNYDYFFESGGAGCTFVLKKEFFLKLAYFLKSNIPKIYAVRSHDWLIYAYARAKSFKWSYDSAITIRYRQHVSNAFGARHGFVGYFKRVRLLMNGWYINEVRNIFDLLSTDSNINFVLNRRMLVRNVFQLRRGFMSSLVVGLYLFLFL